MSEFYKRFLMEEGRRLSSETGRYAALAAFGKHPGWDDHVEDIGLETDSLNFAKQLLYIQGVGGQIDTGAWEKLKEEQRLPAFNHTFVWLRGDQFLLGRMWSSSDGKGRKHYPMILCAHFIGVPLAWAVEHVLPRLEDAEKSCQAVKTADEVRAILGRSRALLRNMLNDPAVDAARGGLAPFALNKFVSAPVFGSGQEGWFRILYGLQSQAKAFGTGQFSLKKDMSGVRAQQLRVPMGLAPMRAVPLWTRFFALHVDRLVPALLAWPADHDWMDVTFGEPASHEYFCLRAGREAVPLATEIPYDFDRQFREAAARQLTAFQTGSTQLPAAPAATEENPDVSGTRRWIKNLTGKFFLLLALVGLAAVAVLFFQNRDGSPAEKPGPQATAAMPAAQPDPDETVSKPKETNAASLARPAVETKRMEEAKRLADEKRLRSEADAARAAAAETARRKAEADAAARPAAQESVKPLAIAQVSNQARTTTDTVASGAAAAPVESARPPAVPAVVGDKIITNGIGMVLLWIPGLPGNANGGWVGKYEVRQKEYEQVAGSNPSKFSDPEQPVENVSWVEAMDFCQKLNAAESATGWLPRGYAYALPTRQQWDYFLGNATFEDRGFENAITSRGLQYPREQPSRVGTMSPNMFGLCDVLGNVWEWCADSDAPNHRELRGAAYNVGKIYQFKPLERTAARRLPPDSKFPDAGFRCVVALAR